MIQAAVTFLMLWIVAPTANLANMFNVEYGTAMEIVIGARCANVDPWLAFAVARVESGFDPHAESPAGAIGMVQVMPSTAAMYGVKRKWLRDVKTNVCVGMRYLMRMYRRFGDMRMALAAYNMGPTRFVKSGYVQNHYPYQVLGE